MESQCHRPSAVTPGPAGWGWSSELWRGRVQTGRGKLTLWGRCGGDEAPCSFIPHSSLPGALRHSGISEAPLQWGAGWGADGGGGRQADGTARVGTRCTTSGLLLSPRLLLHRLCPLVCEGDSQAPGGGGTPSRQQPGSLSRPKEGCPPDSAGTYVNEKSACV